VVEISARDRWGDTPNKCHHLIAHTYATRDAEELIMPIGDYIDTMTTPEPFVWTANA
jgi:hypothetical protein